MRVFIRQYSKTDLFLGGLTNKISTLPWEIPGTCDKTWFLQSKTFSYLVILSKSSFVNKTVFIGGYSKRKIVWFSYTFGFTR